MAEYHYEFYFILFVIGYCNIVFYQHVSLGIVFGL